MTGKIFGFNSVLEYERTHPTLSKMMVGEFGWTVPWMVRLTKDGTLYIQDTEIDTNREDKPHGTSTLRIKRFSDEKDGFELDFLKVEDSIRVVESEENLADGIIAAAPFIKIGNVREMTN